MQSKLLDPLPSHVKDFLRRTTMFLHSLERGLDTKLMFLTHENAEVGSIPLNSKLKSNCKTKF
jgi:hypothetical protein